jgi:hypothetical protein
MSGLEVETVSRWPGRNVSDRASNMTVLVIAA